MSNDNWTVYMNEPVKIDISGHSWQPASHVYFKDGKILGGVRVDYKIEGVWIKEFNVENKPYFVPWVNIEKIEE